MPMAEPKSFEEASIQVASRFLESVVVIDDRAEFTHAAGAAVTSPPTPPTSPSPPPVRGGRTSKLVTPPVAALAAVQDEHGLDAKALVDAFAERGLVCAVLKPALGEDPKPRTVAASRRSDIVVIDWYFHSESGDVSLQLLDGILQSDEDEDNRGRLRLIAIYTGEARLHEIQDRVVVQLADHYPAHQLRRRGYFVVEKGPVRIVIYAKPGARIPNQQRAARRRIVDPAMLPDRLIGEFAGMTSGLVPHVALVSIAAVRRSTHRMLTALHAGLDPAYLWHRAMQGRPADAEDHLVQLVAAEVRSILDDGDAGGAANLQRIRLWLARQAGVDYGDRFSVAMAPTIADLIALLDEGSGSPAMQAKFPSLQRNPPENIKGFAPTTEAATLAHSEFAVVMSQRTRYERRTPKLTLGTILSSGSGNGRRYWLSMQPRCDSVRLTATQNFPLIPLESVASPRKKFGFVLKTGRNRFLRLKAAFRPADLQMVSFSVEAGSDSVDAQPHAGGLAFRTVNGRWYRWMGELKFEPAQRMVEKVAGEFSRVGLTESEWLRRWSPG
jgi:hypothetical protein